MKNRIVEIAEHPARLRVERCQLVIEQADHDAVRVPLDDLAVVIVANPLVSYSQHVLMELAERGAAFITCNKARMPIGMLLPLDGNSVQTERFRHQIALTRPRRKRLWQQVVRAKIHMQGLLLEDLLNDDNGLFALESEVRSGDPGNVEARAARRYWPLLFGTEFRRDVTAGNRNRFLNYGYAIVRAAVARAVCASGLHPSLGLHHHNKYNAWCLADDLMEPFRPLVDRAVFKLVQTIDEWEPLSREARTALLSVLQSHVIVGGEIRSLFDAATMASASLANALTDGSVRLQLPTNVIEPNHRSGSDSPQPGDPTVTAEQVPGVRHAPK